MNTDAIRRARELIRNADAVVVGAGAGLSTAAGFTYSGERFRKYFADAEKTYGFHDMYSGGFYRYPSEETMWTVWSRNIYVNRYMDPPKDTYQSLLQLVKDKDYFVITTNVDHCFQKAGFDKSRLFYTQGDYGLFQCSEPCHKKTYDNEAVIRQMVLAQGFHISDGGSLSTLEEAPDVKLEIPNELISHCPVCGRPMALNLRSDNTFVQDEGWYAAAERYDRFLNDRGEGRIVFLEIGVGYNTPGIIKFPFWRYTAQNPNATYICMSHGHSHIPEAIVERSVSLVGDADEIIHQLNENEA